MVVALRRPGLPADRSCRAAGTSSTVQSIRLYARQPGALGTEQYRVIFRATTDDPKNPGCSYCLDLSISEKHAKQLADCQEDKDAVWHQRLISGNCHRLTERKQQSLPHQVRVAGTARVLSQGNPTIGCRGGLGQQYRRRAGLGLTFLPLHRAGFDT